MPVINSLLGPKSAEELETFAIEDLVFEVQIAIQNAMNSSCTNQKELAERLGISPARVSQLFAASGSNLTLKTIAKVLHALGENLEVRLKSDVKIEQELNIKPSLKIARVKQLKNAWVEANDVEANDNVRPLQKAA